MVAICKFRIHAPMSGMTTFSDSRSIKHILRLKAGTFGHGLQREWQRVHEAEIYLNSLGRLNKFI